MNKILSLLIALFTISISLISCDELVDKLSGGSSSEEQNLDTFYYVNEGIDSLSFVAKSTSGLIAAVKEDSIHGNVFYLNHESYPQDSAIIMSLDTLNRVKTIYGRTGIITFNYHESGNKVDAIVINKDCEAKTFYDLPSPYAESTIQIIPVSTRAGSTLDPTDILSGGLGAASSLSSNLGAAIGGEALNGVGIAGSCVGGLIGNTVGIGVAVGGIALASGTIGPILAAAAAGISIYNTIISEYQNRIAKEYMGNARPETISWQQTGERQITIIARVSNVSADKSEFYVGAMISDGLYITKNHHLKPSYKETYSGNKTYTFVFDNLYKGKTYKARAYIEPSQRIYGDNVLDYFLYGNVLNNIKLKDDIITIESAKQSSSSYDEKALQYVFGIKGKARLNESGYTSWGISLSSGGVSDIVDEAIFTTDAGSFEFTARIARIFMTGNKPISTYKVIPFVVVDGKKKYFESWSKEVDLEYVESSLCPDENHPYAIDLGLPSGTKWSCMNVGATSPEGYGDYFAWGETEPKTTYYLDTYKWCRGDYDTMTKYCTSSSYGTVDNKTTLDPEDDAAHVNWGGAWRMPTCAEQEELREKCTWTWGTQNGVNGFKVTGPNGNSIFLPAAGCRGYGGLNLAGSYGFYWASSLYASASFDAYYLQFYSSSQSTFYGIRCYGRSVRPVCQ